MEVGNKVTTDTGVVLEAKLQVEEPPCSGCYFSKPSGCSMTGAGLASPCWDENGNDLVFVKSEDHE